MAYSVEITELPERPTAVVRFTAHVSELGKHLSHAFKATQAHIAAAGADIAGPAFAYFEQLGDQRFDVRAGFPLSAHLAGAGEVESFTLPAGRIASTLHVGSFQKLSEAYAAIEAAAKDAGETFDPGSPSWEEYLSAPGTPPEQTQTRVFWRLGTR